MYPDNTQNFHERLSQWVANQGFWFQVRYSMSGSGAKGAAMFHLLRISFRIGIFLLILAAGSWIFLVKRTEQRKFNEGLKESLKTALVAKEAELRGFKQSQGNMEISRFAAEGGDATFFQSLEARNIRGKMSLTDGLMGKWDPGIISIFRLDMNLRAGANDAESAANIAEALFRMPETVNARTFEVTESNLNWGFSERTRGRIEGSAMKVRRLDDGAWRVSFKGGTFSQNWLRRLQIVELVAICNREGITFDKAEFRRGTGTVDFSGLTVKAGERPEVSGMVKLRRVALEHILPVAARSFVEGTISGDFTASGSTNTTDGIGFEGQVVLDGLDMVALRDRVHLLRALSVVDVFNNYRRLDFREGTFQIKTTRGGLELRDVDLKAGDLFTLAGALVVRPPTDEERRAILEKNPTDTLSPLFATEDGDADRLFSDADDDAAREFTLRRAAEEAKRLSEGGQPDPSLSLFDRIGLNLESRILEEQAAERLSRILLYKGNFRITLPPDAFDRAENLQTIFPLDSSTGRIPMDVPIDGGLYELTLKQAEYIYEQGRR
jgi:hypothetical protein